MIHQRPCDGLNDDTLIGRCCWGSPPYYRPRARLSLYAMTIRRKVGVVIHQTGVHFPGFRAF